MIKYSTWKICLLIKCTVDYWSVKNVSPEQTDRHTRMREATQTGNMSMLKVQKLCDESETRITITWLQ